MNAGLRRTFLAVSIPWLSVSAGVPPATAANAATSADPALPAAPAPAPGSQAELFLQEVAPLITPAERAAYLELAKPYQRSAFERRFWEVRDPFPETGVNEFAVRWKERATIARERWGSLDDARALAFALAGEPVAKVSMTCSDLLRPGEVWRFGGTSRAGGAVVVFVAEGLSPKSKHRAWRPDEGVSTLAMMAGVAMVDQGQFLERVSRDCPRGSEIASLISVAVDWQGAIETGHFLPHTNDEWIASFSAHSTELPDGVAPLPATLELAFPRRHGLRTMVEGSLRLIEPPAADAAFALDGEVVRGEELFDRFRYRFQASPGLRPAMVFERPLRPGRYRLVLRLHELAGNRYFREERELVVPSQPDAVTAANAATAATAQAPQSTEQIASPFGTENAGSSTGIASGTNESTPTDSTAASGLPLSSPGAGEPMPAEPQLQLTISTEKLVTGKLRLDAEVRAEGVAAVTFALDGKPVLTKRRPPFGVELDLGRVPRLHSVSAIALDASGRELARDEELLNGGPHRFSLRLREPNSIPPGAEQVTARADLDLPEGERLDRVEFFVNSKLYATLYQAPFIQVLPVPPGKDPAWIRAVGYLVGGGAAEDVRLVGSGDYSGAVDVDFVEIYASILDRRGRTIEDVRPDEVTVEEAGVEQAIQRFELQRDLPIHAALLLDTSASMAEELEEAERAGLRFFGEVLTEKDRAAVITFAEEPRLAVRFTGSVEVLAGGLANLEADGETKIWDALAFSLHYFSGIRGKRALILLSDGVDSSSKYAFADVLEYAKRTGVAIYTIGINVPRYPPDASMYLDQLAHQTGGRSYRIDRAVELGPIYQTIERELRAQYLVAYQSSNPHSEGFRPIEIKVKRSGAEVETVAGYYP